MSDGLFDRIPPHETILGKVATRYGGRYGGDWKRTHTLTDKEILDMRKRADAFDVSAEIQRVEEIIQRNKSKEERKEYTLLDELIKNTEL